MNNGYVDPIDAIDSYLLSEFFGSTANKHDRIWIRGGKTLEEVKAMFADSILITGTRAATSYGENIATQLATSLPKNVTLVTGGSYGIEAAAIRGMLAQNRPQIVFLAGPADEFYPRGNASLLASVLAQGGVIVSVLAPGTVPTKGDFKGRGTLMADLVQTVTVVEATRLSGVFDVVDVAEWAGANVWAVPGPITSAASFGPNKLIAMERARTLTDVDVFCAALVR